MMRSTDEETKRTIARKVVEPLSNLNRLSKKAAWFDKERFKDDVFRLFQARPVGIKRMNEYYPSAESAAEAALAARATSRAACSALARSTETDFFRTKPEPRYLVRTSSSAARASGVPCWRIVPS